MVRGWLSKTYVSMSLKQRSSQGIMSANECSYPASSCPPSGLIGHLFCVVVDFLFEWHLRWQSTRVKVKHWTTLGYICHLRSFTMVSYMLLFHGSKVVQTSRISVAKVLMNTCEMWYIKRFWKCQIHTHLCIKHEVQTSNTYDTSFYWPYLTRQGYSVENHYRI
jgi:hypothetical protein